MMCLTMRVARIISAAVCLIVGLVWIGQGLGWIRGSIMTGEPRWSVAGLVLLALAAWQIVSLVRISRASATGEPAPSRRR